MIDLPIGKHNPSPQFMRILARRKHFQVAPRIPKTVLGDLLGDDVVPISIGQMVMIEHAPPSASVQICAVDEKRLILGCCHFRAILCRVVHGPLF